MGALHVAPVAEQSGCEGHSVARINFHFGLVRRETVQFLKRCARLTRVSLGMLGH